MNKSDGGPAFPEIKREFKPCINGGSYVVTEMVGGMTLRDWLAGQALAGMGTWVPPNVEAHKAVGVIHARAEWAYKTADAMLAAREGKSDE